jgi:hypothetical protein
MMQSGAKDDERMSLMDRQRCDGCRYWEAVRDEDGTLLGMCRRNPPAYEGWPMTMPDDWCGRFRPAADPA